MSIDINGISSPKLHVPTDDNQLKQTAEQQVQATKSETGKSSATDTVSLSDNAVSLGKIDNVAIATPVIDAKRVEQVKQAISDGTFKVDNEKVADKLMQFESMLKSSQ